MNNGRDCPHGRQVGKCDTCDLIEVERDLEQTKQILADRTAELEQVKRVANELAAQVEHLRQVANDAIHFATRSQGVVCGDPMFVMQQLQNRIDATPAQCLAEVRAQAVDDVINSVGGYMASSVVNDPEYADGWNSAIKIIKRKVILIRQQAKP